MSEPTTTGGDAATTATEPSEVGATEGETESTPATSTTEAVESEPIDWEIEVERIRKSYAYEGDANFHFLYKCTKR